MTPLGVSGFPVAQAGHASWHRPHSVQATRSRRSFRANPRIAEIPKCSAVVQGDRLDHARGGRATERDVGWCGQDVADQREGQRRDESEGQDGMPPPEHPVQAGLLNPVESGERPRGQPATRRPESPRVPGMQDA